MQPKLTIQILGWNGAKDLPRAVAALQKIPREEAVIRYIDNGSTDGSPALVKKALPHADVIERGVNTGFAGGHNFGLTLCRTEFVLIQDQDVAIDWAGIQEMLKTFDDPKVAAVQGKLYREGNILDSAGIVQTVTFNGRERGAGEEDRGQYEEMVQLLAVTGGCALYRMAALQQVEHTEFDQEEFFDGDFFAYKEDVDLGWRLNIAGWKCLYVPVRMGWHARTIRREGVFNWGLSPQKVWRRLKSPRTRYSLRNYGWMIVKNARLSQLLLRSPLVLGRLAIFFLLSLGYLPLLMAWAEIVRGIPRMLVKRR